MGADTFTVYSTKTESHEAFAELKDNALYEYGHRGYTGTIAEKYDFVIIDDSSNFSLDECHRYASSLIDACDPRIDDKWGPAGALAVTEDGKPAGWLFFGWASS